MKYLFIAMLFVASLPVRGQIVTFYAAKVDGVVVPTLEVKVTTDSVIVGNLFKGKLVTKTAMRYDTILTCVNGEVVIKNTYLTVNQNGLIKKVEFN